MIHPEELARRFHDHYERLAPDHGYKTRDASAVPWEEVPDNNRQLMTATCAAVLRDLHRRRTDKLLLVVDQDGPLAGFDAKGFAVAVAEGIELDCTVGEQTARYMTEHVPDRGHRQRLRDIIDAPGWYRDLPVTPGAQEGMARLAADDRFEVVIATKPQESNSTCRDDKAAWLADHFGREWVSRLFVVPDKSLVRGDLLLDDAPKLEWLPLATWRPVIFPAPFNQHSDSEYSMMPSWTWGDDHDLLLELGGRR